MLQAVHGLAFFIRSLLKGPFVIGLVAVLATPVIQAASLTITATSAADSFTVANLRQFAEAVTQGSKGRLSMAVEAGVKGRKSSELIDGLKRRSLPVVEVPLLDLPLDDSLAGIDGVPFLAMSFPRAQKLWSVVRPQLVATLKARGLHLLYTIAASPPGLISQRPLAHAADFRDRIILDGGGPVEHLIPVSGARGLRVKADAVASAFKQKGLDFIFISPQQAVQDQAWRYARYYTRVSAWFPKHLVLINASDLNGLEQPLRTLLLTTAAAMEAAVWADSRSYNAGRIQILRDYGMQIIKPTVALQLELQVMGRKLLFDWSEGAGDGGARLVEDYYAVR